MVEDGVVALEPVWERLPLELLVVPDCACCVEDVAAAVEDPVPWVLCGDRAPEEELPAPSPLVLRVREVVEGLVACEPTSLPGPQALVDAQVLLEAAQLLRVHNLRRVADVQVRQLHALSSARSTGAWLRRVAPDGPAGDLALARRLRVLPVLRARVESGALSLRVGAGLAAALWRARAEVDRPDGLIDGQPACEVLPAVREVAGQVAQCRLGVPEQDPVLLGLREQLERVLADGGSELGQLERALVLLAEHVPPVWLAGSV